MSEADKRMKDRQELDELILTIEPAKNEDIARRAIDIAYYHLAKAENQAKHIQDLETRNSKIAQPEQRSPCDLCRYNPPSSMDGKPCFMCPAEPYREDEG